MEKLSIIGSIASIMGLLITFITLMTITQIKKFYIIKATIPEQIKRLSEFNGNLIKLLPQLMTEKEQIITIIIQMETIILSISKKVQSELKTKTKEILKLNVRNSIDEEKIRIFYENTLELYSMLQENIRDKEWEAK
jgi:hypothetical protein